MKRTKKPEENKANNNSRIKLTDKSIMAFGMFKGKALANVENSYLRWFYEQNFGRKKSGFNLLLMNYIEENKEMLIKS